jgi:Sulfotransferase domain
VRAPDFFLVGHQKCGTTALYLMLKSHPQIFMPDVKEPRFFASDLRSSFGKPSERRPRTLDGYLSLFAAAAPEQRLGDASPQYLRSRVAPQAIADVQPDARIVAVLREPASFLRSFHLQMVSSNVETQRDLRKAIALEDARRRGERIPRLCHNPASLLYSDHVRYVEQLRRYHAVFPAQNVLVLIYDDFRRDNQATVRAVLRFLDVDDTAAVAAVETGPARGVRAQPLHQLAHAARTARRNPAAAGPLARAAGALTRAPARSDALRAFWRRAVYRDPRPPDAAFMLELRRRFKPEVVALSDYLSRDLVSEWGYDDIG